MKVFLLRHGRSEGNELGLFQGKLDYPLSQEGRRQAERAADFLKNLNLSKVYSSPQKRALETAKVVAERLGLPLEVDGRLREISYGILEGRRHEEVLAWEAYRRWLEDPVRNPLEGVEDLFEAQRRVADFLKDLSEDRALVVTHGGIIRVALCTVGGIPLSSLWRFSVGNCSLSGLELESLDPPRGKIRFVNLPTEGLP
ncbi:MAG: histidine phosphatase family protein [Aquificae bacterium]|nr:histidine phosphatase family protein [Aquificota bacterium]